MSSVTALRTEADRVLSDLDALREAVASGAIPATTVLVLTRDRVSEVTSFTLCGEGLAYSHLVGLLYQQANALCAEGRGGD